MAQGRVGTPAAAVKQQQVALGDLLSGDAAAALEGYPASAGQVHIPHNISRGLSLMAWRCSAEAGQKR